jgi:hypothetical protein
MDEDGFIPIGSVPFPVFTQKRYKESDGESDGESDVTVELISTDGQLLKPEESYEKLRKKLESSCKKHYATEALQLSNLLDGLLTKASQKPLNQQALDNLLLETLTFGVSHPLLAPTLFKATANYFLQGSENLKLLYEALTTDHVDKVNTRTKRPKIQQAINAIAPDNEKTKKNQLLLSLRYSVNATLSIEPPLYDYKNIDIYYNLPGINFRKYGDHANFLFFYFSPVPKDENTKRTLKTFISTRGLPTSSHYSPSLKTMRLTRSLLHNRCGLKSMKSISKKIITKKFISGRMNSELSMRLC